MSKKQKFKNSSLGLNFKSSMKSLEKAQKKCEKAFRKGSISAERLEKVMTLLQEATEEIGIIKTVAPQSLNPNATNSSKEE